MNDTGKTCPDCGLQKLTIEFPKDSKNKDGRSTYCKKCKHARVSDWSRRMKDIVIKKYGNRCACCGESIRKFLTIDHMDNDGNVERKYNTARSNSKTFQRLYRMDGLAKNIQVLCLNCNMGKHLNGGVCPHKTERKT